MGIPIIRVIPDQCPLIPTKRVNATRDDSHVSQTISPLLYLPGKTLPLNISSLSEIMFVEGAAVDLSGPVAPSLRSNEYS
jgi:hypothetical protein